jgi:hypothetical protein
MVENLLIEDFTPSHAASRVSFPDGSPCILVPRRLRHMAYEFTRYEHEVAWHGTVLEVKPQRFLLTDFIVTKQEASPIHVTLLGDDTADLISAWAEQGDEGEAKINSLRFWGQSHHGMGVTPSSIDDSAFERIRRQNLPWFIQGIFNRHGEINFKAFLFGGKVVVENVRWIPVDTMIPEVRQLAQTQVREMLTVVPPPADLLAKMRKAGDFTATELTELGVQS